jgi:hypothetical protein
MGNVRMLLLQTLHKPQIVRLHGLQVVEPPQMGGWAGGLIGLSGWCGQRVHGVRIPALMRLVLNQIDTLELFILLKSLPPNAF